MVCFGRQTVDQTLSLFGSSVVQYAIFWYLVLRSNSGMVMTGAMVAAALPQAIVSVFGGVWADRWNRKLLVMLPDAVIAAVTICLSASMAVGWGDTGLILVVLVIRSVGGGIQTPAVQSFIPQIVPEAWLLRRSTSTGQETFFRRDQICQRIRLILDNKEHQTLDELAASLAEKRQTVLARRKLIIETAYGRREFPLEEVRSAVVAEGTHQEDVLQLLKEITL